MTILSQSSALRKSILAHHLPILSFSLVLLSCTSLLAWENKPLVMTLLEDTWQYEDWQDAYRPKELICVKPSVQPVGDGKIGIYWRTTVYSKSWAEVSQDGGATWTECYHNVDGMRAVHGQTFTAVFDKYDMTKPLKYRVIARPIQEVGTWGSVRFYGEEWIAGNLQGYYPPKNYREQLKQRRENYTGEQSVEEGELKAVDPNNFDVVVLNDIHHNTVLYPQFLKLMSDKTVLTVLAGDICDHARSSDDFYKFLCAPMSYISRHTKGLSVFVRGNHETMGIYAPHVRDHVALFLNDFFGETLFGAYTIGNTRFAFIDTANDAKSENNPKSPHDELWDLGSYFTKESKWLEAEFASDAWTKAKNLVCISHIPPWGYDTNSLLSTLIFPLVKKAGVSLYCAGHEHDARQYPKNVELNKVGKQTLSFDIAVGGGPNAKPKNIDPEKPPRWNSWPTMIIISVRNGKMTYKCIDINGENIY